MNSLKLSTYIFDFDGTLADSMLCWSEKMLNILTNNNIDYPFGIIKQIAPLGDIGTAKYFKEVLGVNLSIEEMLKQMDAFALPKYRDVIALKPGVLDYLHVLKNDNCGLNVLTASPHKMVDVCLKRNSVFDLFDNVWSCDDFNMTKSGVRIYTEAVKRIGTQVSNTVFFDDNIYAIQAASKADLCTVGVYDKTSEDFAERLAQISDFYIDSFVGLQPIHLFRI